jgi:hypothetical protein
MIILFVSAFMLMGVLSWKFGIYSNGIVIMAGAAYILLLRAFGLIQSNLIATFAGLLFVGMALREVSR